MDRIEEGHAPIKWVRLENFVFFDKHHIPFSEGVNVMIGEHVSGRAFIMKFLYSLLHTLDTVSLAYRESGGHRNELLVETFAKDLEGKLERVFLTKSVGNMLLDRASEAVFELNFGDKAHIAIALSGRGIRVLEEGDLVYALKHPIKVFYLPSYYPVFPDDEIAIRNLREKRLLEEVYFDFAEKVFLLRGTPDREIDSALEEVINRIRSSVERVGGQFSSNYQKLLRFVQLFYKTDFTGAYVFIDQPEAGISPVLSEPIVDLVLMLSKNYGAQVLVSTDDYFTMKWFQIKGAYLEEVGIRFLSINELGGGKEVESKEDFYDIERNPVMENFKRILEADIEAESISRGKRKFRKMGP